MQYQNVAAPIPWLAELTDDPLDVLSFAAASYALRIPCALVTLVDIHGGSARALGAHMAVRADGGYCGFVSGGCTEAAVAAEALAAIADGQDRYLRLGLGSPYFDIVLPCGGGIGLAIHVLRNAGPVAQVLADIAARRPCGLRYDRRRQTLLRQDAGQTGWRGDVFHVSYRPPVQLVLAGGAIELQSIVAVARTASYRVEVLRSADNLNGVTFDRWTAVALLYHDLDRELAILARALRSEAFYIGALGSVQTHSNRMSSLRALGFGDMDVARIQSPIGLFKVRDSASLALSIIAEIASKRSQLSVSS